jgi:DNA-directed RNA polymerase specialized sigma24 family protein
VFHHAIGRSTRNAVVIAYPPAKTALCRVLNDLSHGQEDGADAKAGIWVLSEPQAQLLYALVASSEERRRASIRTLADLLYADRAKGFVSEQEWTLLVRSMASGDQRAMHALYERTHRLVFTLIARITGNLANAEELALDAFDRVWRRASTYDPAKESVLAWVMDQARSSATHALRMEKRTTLRRVKPFRVARSTGILCPPSSLRERLARRIAIETGSEPVVSAQHWAEPHWEEVAPGISCKLLAVDMERDQVSMLVRLAPLVEYPPHTHAGVEELHLLYGELWINERKLFPGDYNRAAVGSSDTHVWTETGCTCVLTTSGRDVIS